MCHSVRANLLIVSFEGGNAAFDRHVCKNDACIAGFAYNGVHASSTRFVSQRRKSKRQTLESSRIQIAHAYRQAFKPETRSETLVDAMNLRGNDHRRIRYKAATCNPRENNNSLSTDSQEIPIPVTVRAAVVKVALKSTKIVHLVPQLLHTVRRASRGIRIDDFISSLLFGSVRRGSRVRLSFSFSSFAAIYLVARRER